MKSIECVIDSANMWRFKSRHLKKNLAGYMYKDKVSSQTNVEVLNANFDVEHSYEIIGLFEEYWGSWSSIPNADIMQIVAKKWYEKYDAELIRISCDTLSFECRKLSENEAQILMQEIKDLGAEIIDCSADELLDHLMEKQRFTLWWE